MAKSGGNSGCAVLIGGFFVIGLLAMIPKPVWITFGVLTALAVLVVVIVKSISAYDKHRVATEERERVERAAKAAADKRERARKAAEEKQRSVETMGKANAEFVDMARGAVKRVAASEAARAGWLGDVDFTADMKSITDHFEKAYALRKVANQLSALDKPSVDDRKILAEATTTVANLELAANERIELIIKCATEAQAVDESLSTERRDAQTAEQRAELHAKLSAMLYGIEATPDDTPSNSAADGVMARVQAYREIKDSIARVTELSEQ